MSWFARPVRVVDDFHPFSSIHRRTERRIIPQIRKNRAGLYVVLSILGSAAVQEVLSKGLPASFTAEWKAKEKLYDEAQFANAITRHQIGSDPVVPPYFLSPPKEEDI